MLKKIVLSILVFFSVFLLTPEAKSYTFKDYNVDINIREDSVMEVEETLTYNFQGNFRGVFRDITLTDFENLKYCQTTPEAQCGGFDRLEITEVKDSEGKVLTQSAYTTETYYNEDAGENRIKVTWVFSETGKDFNGEDFKFSVKYLVYGGIGEFDDYDLFYWNTLPPERESSIDSAIVRINLPDKIQFNPEDHKVFGDIIYNYEYDEASRSLILKANDISTYDDFTVMWKLPKGVLKTASLKLINEQIAPIDPSFLVNGVARTPINDFIRGIPAGEVEFTATRFGYKNQVEIFNLKPGEIKEINIKLEPQVQTTIINLLTLVANILGCIGIPGGMIFLWNLWRTKGKDATGKETIVPEYRPPEDIKPYLLGSLKDEKVDIVDITATLIDVAYLGYIKIIEIPKKFLSSQQYEFQKLKSFDDLSKNEVKILEDIFGYKDRVTTSDLTDKFYTKISGIKKAIYSEMVEKGYFANRPDSVRQKYVWMGCFAIFCAIILLSCVSVGLIVISGVPTGIVSMQCALLIVGVLLFPLSYIMPAKTTKGREVLDKINGFRMYMYTAERFRVQDLKPEIFEKYLSYAIVFGIEKEWANKFKDIYTSQPSWYEGNGAFDAYLFSSALRTMTHEASASMQSMPSSSGSGSGWSGGGGFSGGFSGGGGGGGGAGAF